MTCMFATYTLSLLCMFATICVRYPAILLPELFANWNVRYLITCKIKDENTIYFSI